MHSDIPNPITLEDIRKAGEKLSNAHNDTAACAALLQAEIKAVIAPILDKYKATLDRYACAEAAAHAALDGLLMAAPHLFAKPRSLTVDGVRVGYRKAEDSIDWSDEEAVIKAIGAYLSDQFAILVRTERHINIDAVSQLDADTLRKIGVRQIPGVDTRFITIGDNDAEKLTKVVIADAARRQGEEEVTKAKKPKAKVAA